VRIVLAALENGLADAWAEEFRGYGDVYIHRGSIFDIEADALVSPANSFGFMDGGIDAAYSARFGVGLEGQIRRAIFIRHDGELLVGAGEIVGTGESMHPFVIAAPTMRVPMVLNRETINPFLATRAALRLVGRGVFEDGTKIRDRVRTVAFPGMGNGCRPPSSKAVCASDAGSDRWVGGYENAVELGRSERSPSAHLH
jgi:O-acetyl-ADP-ribose deacetylase (regulator of RNase III)